MKGINVRKWNKGGSTENEYERQIELSYLASEVEYLFEECDLRDSDVLDFLISLVNHFFVEEFPLKYPFELNQCLFKSFLGTLEDSVDESFETQKVMETYEETLNE